MKIFYALHFSDTLYSPKQFSEDALFVPKEVSLMVLEVSTFVILIGHPVSYSIATICISFIFVIYMLGASSINMCL